jgi:hypothetical protein
MSSTGYGNTQMNTQNLQNFPTQVRVNTSTTSSDISNMVSSYYSNLQNYLTPSMANLQLIQNVKTDIVTPNYDQLHINNYGNELGDGHESNLGFLNGVSYPSINYGDARADKLSKCAKELPMFAASSLLPKPSTNSSNTALSQSAARALAAFTALGPVEQIGALTTLGNMPYGTTTDFRAVPLIPQSSVLTPLFMGPSNVGISPVYGSVISGITPPRAGPNVGPFLLD